ncbi:MAG: DUF16 domain-containing protein [Cyanobacteria bacterium P01_D01_bin.71]
MPDPIDSLAESTNARLQRLEQKIAEYQASTDQRLDAITKQITSLTTTISNQAASIDRLERSITNLTNNIESQRQSIAVQAQTMNNFLELAKQQSRIVEKALDMAQPRAAA